MGGLALLRCTLLVHRFYLGTSSRLAIAHLALLEVMCLVGASANVLRVPERWLHVKQPTQGVRKAQLFDYLGNSHQIMHLLSAVAIWHIYESVSAESHHVLVAPDCSVHA